MRFKKGFGSTDKILGTPFVHKPYVFFAHHPTVHDPYPVRFAILTLHYQYHFLGDSDVGTVTVEDLKGKG